MSGSNRVKSTKAAGEAQPSADNASQSPQDAPAKAAGNPEEAEAQPPEKASGEAQASPAKGDPNPPPPPEKTALKYNLHDQDEDESDDEDEEAADDENEEVSGVTAEELAGGQTRGRAKRKPRQPPVIPDGHRAMLSSPANFGIWIDGKLHQFKKGRTPLTAEQHDACHLDDYVRDNGASISYTPLKKKAQ